jgi:hypothetical protein
MEKYFLKAFFQEQFQEVTKQEWIKAERRAGFRPKMASTDPGYMDTCATGGFSNGSITGRIEYIRCIPDKITHLQEGEIFVFGSNRQGIHGNGAAKQAVLYGAKKFIGVGPSGDTYAIPTRDYHGFNKFTTLSIEEIKSYVNGFIAYASSRKHLRFLVTPIGTGYAGYSDEQMAPLFKEAISMGNIYLPEKWIKINLVS